MYINTIQPWKRNSAISDNMDEPGRHYAKWNKTKKDKYCVNLQYVEN